jgi:SAM-dependent methyltransferase
MLKGPARSIPGKRADTLPSGMKPPWGDYDYESLPAAYSQYRRPDPRIAAHIHAALGDARTVLNIGAGSGSYEPTDRYVLAVEPSRKMRSQRPRGAAPAIIATAEQLPMDDGAVDAAMALLTVHQWSDMRKGLAELKRVTKAAGPIVLMVFDPARCREWWLTDYIPELLDTQVKRDPALPLLADLLGGRVETRLVPIPMDCTDGFSEAFYARPEKFLDDAVRQCQSTWKFLPEDVHRRAIERLRADLASGAWDERHGAWRTRPTFEGSLVLVISTDR